MDIKSSSVQFYVQRSSNFNVNNSVIPWEFTRLNIGNAMNTASGVFTAPKDGIYHFHFSLYGNVGAASHVWIRLNGGNIGRTYVHDYDVGTVQSTLQLKQGDQIDLFKNEGVLYDNNSEHLSHFTGWLDEEDLVLS